MKDMIKTKKQLREELADLRKKIKDFENSSFDGPEALHELTPNEALYRLLVENASEAILVIQDENIRYVNKKATEITGYSKKELSSRSLIDFIHPDDRRLIPIDKILKPGSKTVSGPFTCRIIDKNGKTNWLEAKLLGTNWAGESSILLFLIIFIRSPTICCLYHL